MEKVASSSKDNTLLLLISAILITNFLFFIDEGYYDFRWMAEAGNWFAFAIYLLIIFMAQLLFSNVFLKKYRGKDKTLLSILGGAVIGFGFVVLIFSSLKFFFN